MREPGAMMKATIGLLCLLGSCALILSCNRSKEGSPGLSYRMDTVMFVEAAATVPAAGPQPAVSIDTHMKMTGVFGGTIRTRAPYSIRIDYSDTGFLYTEAEFTKLGVTYDDGTEDPEAAARKLPIHIAARPYETINSMAGGNIVKTKLQVISGKIAGVISRDQPFTLQLEGNLIRNDGSKVPFAIHHQYDVVRDKSTRPWSEVMSEI
ncbi:MAG: hypothetical protein LR011_09560 [Verrucomicrobia bacterium]|nr:hypothetical protein [Verrucomicrobiota bacterium]